MAMVRMEAEPPDDARSRPGDQDPGGRMPEESFGGGFYLRLCWTASPRRCCCSTARVWGESIPDFARRNPAGVCIDKVIQVVQANRRQKTRQEGETP